MKDSNNYPALLILGVLAAIVFGTTTVLADPTAPETLTQVESSSRDLSGLSAQSVNAQGGNVTQVNIHALTITTSWQGYYGDVTGEITLDDANNNTFYNWSTTTVEGEIYATRASSIQWGNVNCSSAANVTSEETYLGQVAGDGDSVSNTFNQAIHPAFAAGTSQVLADTCPSTFGYTNNNTQSSNWIQVLLHDGEENVVYSTIINDTTLGFDGSNYDFQLLVGENEKTGNIGVTPYYFWVELN